MITIRMFKGRMELLEDYNEATEAIMSKKALLIIILLLIAGGVTYVYMLTPPVSTHSSKTPPNVEDLHSDILSIIAQASKKVMGITPQEASSELQKREIQASPADRQQANVRLLSFEILVFIAKSPTSVAEIQPKQAVNEIVRRYLAIDDEDLTFKSMVIALKHSNSQEAIEKWAKNEDAEEMEAFIADEANNDDLAAFAYGVKHRFDNQEEAIERIKKFANHVNNINDPKDSENYEKLIKAINSLG